MGNDTIKAYVAWCKRHNFKPSRMTSLAVYNLLKAQGAL